MSSDSTITLKQKNKKLFLHSFGGKKKEKLRIPVPSGQCSLQEKSSEPTCLL